MNLFKKLKNRKILLIDDDEWIRDSMALFFEDEECCLRTFETAEEGLSEINSSEFDIIIADYMLPGITGLEFFERIQTTCKNAIKILITAYGTDEVFLRARQLGVHDIIEKPFKTENIETSLAPFI
ncbi:MAG: response regulator [Desulfobacterales bacterium]|nr:response regulator [Desulfobacterales bacterium]